MLALVLLALGLGILYYSLFCTHIAVSMHTEDCTRLLISRFFVVCTVPTEQDLTNLPRSKRKKLKKKIRQQKERTEDLLYEQLRQLQIKVRAVFAFAFASLSLCLCVAATLES